jgi:hypothetical protein
VVLRNEEKWKESREYLEKALKIKKEKFGGENNLEYTKSLENLALI